ncbi:hypothetical protein FOZ60_004567 [Perkinsus olseni]|uniref:non-specific serine/threonine protein kinase n=2 Tax=Perkinsus olseni TaxID=32597 RepID=A0A7J6PH95_PEROL|nr:hypothetical protein FOZ60_004567 [Perkinsus olseni]
MLNAADRSRASCNAHLIFATVISLAFLEDTSRDLFAPDTTECTWACVSPLFGRTLQEKSPRLEPDGDHTYLRVTLPRMAAMVTNAVCEAGKGGGTGIGSKLSTSVLATARDLTTGSKCGASCWLCQFAMGQVLKLVGGLTGETEPYRALMTSNPRVVLDRGVDDLPPPLPEVCKPFFLPALFAAHLKRCRIRSLFECPGTGQVYLRSALIPALSSLWQGGRHGVCLLLDLPSTVTRLRSDKESLMPLVGESLVQLFVNALISRVKEEHLKHHVLHFVRFLSLDDSPNVTNTGAMEDLVTDCLAEALWTIPVFRAVLDIYGGRHSTDTIVEADCGGLLFLVLLRFARRFLHGTDTFETIKAVTNERVDKILAHSARIVCSKAKRTSMARAGDEPPAKRARSSESVGAADKLHALKCYYLYVLKLMTDASVKGTEQQQQEPACYCTALALLLDIVDEQVLQLYWSQNLDAVRKLTLKSSLWQSSEGEALLRPWKSLYDRSRDEEKRAMLSTYMVDLPRVGYDQARSYARGLPKQVITDPHSRILFGGDHTRLEEGQVKAVLLYVLNEIVWSPPRPDCCIEGILVLLADLLLSHYAETWNDPYGELEALANQLDRHLSDLLLQRDAAASGTLSIAVTRALGSLGRWRHRPNADRHSAASPGHRARIGIEDPERAWCDNSNGEVVAKELAVHLLLTYIIPKMGGAKYSYLAQAVLTAMGGGNFLESAVSDDLLSRVAAETLWPYLSTSYKVASATDEHGLVKDPSEWTVQTLARWVVRELPGTQNNTVKVRRLMLAVDLLLKQSSTVASEVLPTLVAALLYSNKDTQKMLDKLFMHMQKILSSQSANRPVLAVIIKIYEIVESWAGKLPGNSKRGDRLGARLAVLLRDRQATYLSLSKAAERCEMWSHALLFMEKAYAPPSATVMTADDYVHMAGVFSKMRTDSAWDAAGEAGALAVAKKLDSTRICWDGAVAAEAIMDDTMSMRQQEEHWIRKAALLGKWSEPTTELEGIFGCDRSPGQRQRRHVGKKDSTLLEDECRQKARTLFDLEWCLTNRSSLCLPQTLRVRVGTEAADETLGRPVVAMAAIRGVGGNPQQLSHLLWEHLRALRRAGRYEVAERVGVMCRAQPDIYRERSVQFTVEMSKVYRDLGKISKSREALEDVAQLLIGRRAQEADKDVAWCVKLDRLRYSCSKNLMQPRESIPVFREVLAEAASLPAKRRARGHFAFAHEDIIPQKMLQEITVQYMLAIQFGTKHELMALNRILRIIWDQGSGALVNLISRDFLPLYEKCIGDLSRQKSSSSSVSATQIIENASDSRPLVAPDNWQILENNTRDLCRALFVRWQQRANERVGMVIRNLAERCESDLEIPLRVWFTALPQLLSRLHNPDDLRTLRILYSFMRQARLPKSGSGVSRLGYLEKAKSCGEEVHTLTVTFVCSIISKLLVKYPRQSRWHVLPFIVNHTSGESSKDRNAPRFFVDTMKVLHEKALPAAMQADSEGVEQHKALIRELCGLCVDTNCKLQRLIRGGRGSPKVAVPLQQYIGYGARLDSDQEDSVVGVASWGPKVKVMASKAKPKKIVMCGTDGRQYPFLAKQEAHGDMRKDARMMDLFTMINHNLDNHSKENRNAADSEGEARGSLLKGVKLRTYAVVCLSSAAALIEWMTGFQTMRDCITSAAARVLEEGSPFVKLLNTKVRDDILAPNGTTAFVRLVRENPPVLQHWHFALARDADHWLHMRNRFVATQALWCMVGYIIGLGDRHCENIMMSDVDGELTHVDFDCIFDAGHNLKVPELVPFRLTSNCVSAMGANGVEGPFRWACIEAMSALRAHKRTLLSVMFSFVADPVTPWSTAARTKQFSLRGGKAEVNLVVARASDNADKTVKEVEQKLSGVVFLANAEVSGSGHGGGTQDPLLLPANDIQGEFRGASISVEGQVDELIRIATSTKYLTRMYIGWMPLL